MSLCILFFPWCAVDPVHLFDSVQLLGKSDVIICFLFFLSNSQSEVFCSPSSQPNLFDNIFCPTLTPLLGWHKPHPDPFLLIQTQVGPPRSSTHGAGRLADPTIEKKTPISGCIGALLPPGFCTSTIALRSFPLRPHHHHHRCVLTRLLESRLSLGSHVPMLVYKKLNIGRPSRDPLMYAERREWQSDVGAARELTSADWKTGVHSHSLLIDMLVYIRALYRKRIIPNASSVPLKLNFTSASKGHLW